MRDIPIKQRMFAKVLIISFLSVSLLSTEVLPPQNSEIEGLTSNVKVFGDGPFSSMRWRWGGGEPQEELVGARREEKRKKSFSFHTVRPWQEGGHL